MGELYQTFYDRYRKYSLKKLCKMFVDAVVRLLSHFVVKYANGKKLKYPRPEFKVAVPKPGWREPSVRWNNFSKKTSQGPVLD
jgi:hypothetical protein